MSPALPRRLAVFLVRPTKYDDEGYLLRHFRGVLPSNSLATLRGLTLAARSSPEWAGIDLAVECCDESVAALPERRLRRRLHAADTRTVIALVGVQTSQMPRARDLALRWRRLGARVLIGGFHVSGALLGLALPDGAPGPHAAAAVSRAGVGPELGELLAAGVTLVRGEVEETWSDILLDVLHDRLHATYGPAPSPALAHAPPPSIDRAVAKRYAYRHFATLDTSRGCPFSCSFCAIIAVQGRRMRSRSPEDVARAVRDTYERLGTKHWFFTDDDFARNPHWREILEVLITLREHEGIPVRFLMQADLQAHRLPGFIDLARRAGCFQVFLGLETLDPGGLMEAEKVQNRVGEYAATIRTWRRAEILTHVGYILGFPGDDPDSVRRDLRMLADEVAPDLASFFLLTPLPGSADHARLLATGTPLDDDLNRFDTFHAVRDHPRMDRAAWEGLLPLAWNEFYTPQRIRARLARVTPEQRVTLAQMLLWYLAAIRVDRFHPMMTGFLRLRPRRDRRPGHPVDSLVRHVARRAIEIGRDGLGYARILGELADAWPGEATGEGPGARWAARASVLRTLFGEAREVGERGTPSLLAPVRSEAE